jgi:hypothetical protein
MFFKQCVINKPTTLRAVFNANNSAISLDFDLAFTLYRMKFSIKIKKESSRIMKYLIILTSTNA